MSVEKRLQSLEQVTRAGDPEDYPEIIIHVGWNDNPGKITVDGVEMSREEINRRWPGWDKGPIDISVNWGNDE